MRAKALVTTLALSAVLFAGCGLKSNEAIITVNNQKITQGQFDKLFDKLYRYDENLVSLLFRKRRYYL